MESMLFRGLVTAVILVLAGCGSGCSEEFVNNYNSLVYSAAGFSGLTTESALRRFRGRIVEFRDEYSGVACEAASASDGQSVWINVDEKMTELIEQLDQILAAHAASVTSERER